MNVPHDRWRDFATKLLILLPIIGLTFNIIAWLQYGIDLPYFDTWGDYIARQVGSFEWQFLFKAQNDSFYPTGRFLDSIAQRLLDGNTIVYQFLSMIIVLGLLLRLQWCLLVLTVPNRLLAACAFSLTLFMLMPGSYWGLQNQAYIQALPLIFILTALYIVLSGTWSARWGIWVIFILGILSGLSYVSGAFAALVAGVVFLLASRFIQFSDRKPLVWGGIALFAAGILIVIPQFWVIAVIQKGIHIPNTAMALPTEGVFWMYLLGKVGRALIPLPYYPVLSLIIVIAVVVVACTVLVLLARSLIRGKMCSLPSARMAIIYITLFSVIFVYLGLVSAGRAHTVPPDMKTSLIGQFVFGFPRFHHFWVTLLWPWLAVAGFNILRITNISKYWAVALVGVAIVLALAILVGNSVLYRLYAQVLYKKHVICLLSELQKGRGINCPSLYPGNLSQAFVYGRQIGASFTRYFPISPIPIGTNTPKPLYRLSNVSEGSPFSFKVDRGAMQLKQCLILDVSARLHANHATAVQLSYKVSHQSGNFTEIMSKPILIKPPSSPQRGSEFTEVVFQVDSNSGFLNEFQLNAVKQSQEVGNISKYREFFQPNTVSKPWPFNIKDLEVRCRLALI